LVNSLLPDVSWSVDKLTNTSGVVQLMKMVNIYITWKF